MKHSLCITTSVLGLLAAIFTINGYASVPGPAKTTDYSYPPLTVKLTNNSLEPLTLYTGEAAQQSGWSFKYDGHQIDTQIPLRPISASLYARYSNVRPFLPGWIVWIKKEQINICGFAVNADANYKDLAYSLFFGDPSICYVDGRNIIIDPTETSY